VPGPYALTSQVGDVRRGWRQAPITPLPAIETRPGGEWGPPQGKIEAVSISRDRIVDRLSRPASLTADAQAFAVTIIGDSMWPRYRPGRRIAVSPAAPVGIGDDVLVLFQVDGDGRQQALIKELVRRSATLLELRQFTPETIFEVDARPVVSLFKIVGELF
jgi:SOS-response transcriptional repressor LexA